MTESELPPPLNKLPEEKKQETSARKIKKNVRRRGGIPLKIVAATLVGGVLGGGGAVAIHSDNDKPSRPPAIEQITTRQDKFITPQSLEQIMAWAEQRERNDNSPEPITSSVTTPFPEPLLAKISSFSENYPRTFLEIAPYLPFTDFKEEIWETAEKNPMAFLLNARALKKVMPLPEWSHLTEKAFAKDPDAISKHVDAKTKLLGQTLLQEITNPELPSTPILTKLVSTETAVLLDKMVTEGLTEDETVTIISDKDKLFREMIAIKSKPNHLGENTLDHALLIASFDKTHSINERHDLPDAERFASISKLSAKDLYTTILYSDNRIYTSSFNGIFNRMKEKMQQEGLSGEALLKQVGKNKFRTFMKELATFNRLDDFLQTMPHDVANNSVREMVNNLEQADNKIEQATVVADIFSTISDPEVLKLLQYQIKNEYERIASQPASSEKEENKTIYGFLASVSQQRLENNDSWFKDKAQEFKLPDITKIESSEFFDKDNTNIQQYFFYDDREDKEWDGHNSFRNMLNAYGFGVEWNETGEIAPIEDAEVDGWKIKDKGTYVIITKAINSKKIKLYANKPTNHWEGQDEMKNVLSGEDVQVITHRGHSYHNDDTLLRIPPSARIVNLGSCGGSAFTKDALQKAPSADIIGTKGTGTMEVNDVIIKHLNEKILSGKDIVWSDFWKELKKELKNNPDFKDYIPPHENYGAIFYAALSRIHPS